jgi:hypothetical protein
MALHKLAAAHCVCISCTHIFSLLARNLAPSRGNACAHILSHEAVPAAHLAWFTSSRGNACAHILSHEAVPAAHLARFSFGSLSTHESTYGGTSQPAIFVVSFDEASAYEDKLAEPWRKSWKQQQAL